MRLFLLLCMFHFQSCGLDQMAEDTEQMNETTQAVSQEIQALNSTTHEVNDNTEKLTELTEQLNEQTKSLNERTEELAKKTDEVKNLTDQLRILTEKLYALTGQLYQGSRTVLSADLRGVYWDLLLHSQTQPTAIAHASAYLQAMEFQFLSREELSDPETTQRYYRRALDELLRKIPELAHSDLKLESILTDQSDKMLSLRALAIALHAVSSDQEDYAAEDSEFVPTHLLSLIEQGLLSKFELKAGLKLEELPEWKRSVLAYEKYALYLLNIRQNFILAMAFQKLAGQDASQIFFWGSFHSEWTPKLQALNEVELDALRIWTQECLRLRGFLKPFGLVKDPELKRAYQKMDFSAFKVRVSNEHSRLISELGIHMRALFSED